MLLFGALVALAVVANYSPYFTNVPDRIQSVPTYDNSSVYELPYDFEPYATYRAGDSWYNGGTFTLHIPDDGTDSYFTNTFTYYHGGTYHLEDVGYFPINGYDNAHENTSYAFFPSVFHLRPTWQEGTSVRNGQRLDSVDFIAVDMQTFDEDYLSDVVPFIATPIFGFGVSVAGGYTTFVNYFMDFAPSSFRKMPNDTAVSLPLFDTTFYSQDDGYPCFERIYTGDSAHYYGFSVTAVNNMAKLLSKYVRFYRGIGQSAKSGEYMEGFQDMYDYFITYLNGWGSQAVENAYSVGYSYGRSATTTEGQTITNLFGAIIDVPFHVLNGLASFTIWDISVIGIIGTALMVLLILWVVKKFI